MGDRGRQIRDGRRKAGLTQEQLADLVGASQSLVSQWERGEKTPSADGFVKLAEVLDIPIGSLLYGRELTEQRGNANLSTGRGAIPMLRIADAAARRTPELDAQKIVPNFPCGARAYWFYIPDDSNAPKCPRGARAVWDPEATATPGSVVLAVYGDEATPVIGELSYESGPSGHVVVVTPTNRLWPAARSDHGRVEVISVMTEISIPLTR